MPCMCIFLFINFYSWAGPRLSDQKLTLPGILCEVELIVGVQSAARLFQTVVETNAT